MARYIIAGMMLGLPTSSSAAETDQSLDPGRVRQLVRQLEAPRRESRDEAEQRLRALGPDVLELLPAIDANTSGELTQRLIRIRTRLEKQQVQATASASRVDLSGKMKLTEAFDAIERQTGNKIVDYRSRFNQRSDDATVDVDFQGVPFWEALDRLLDQAELTVNNFVGSNRMLAVVAKPESALPRRGRATYNGLFRIEPTKIVAERDLANPGASALRLNLEILWEPRVLPILIRQDLEQITITADDGRALNMSTRGVLQLPVQPGVSNIDIRLPMELPPRDVTQIDSLKGNFTALVPGGDVEFTFDELVGARNVQQRRGDLTVVLDRVRRNGGVQEIRVRLRFDQPGDALQSHLDWVSNNQAVLIGPDGKQADDPNYEKYFERENEVGFAYLFPVTDDLEGYRFVYKTPAGIADIPVEYELKDIMLP